MRAISSSVTPRRPRGRSAGHRLAVVLVVALTGSAVGCGSSLLRSPKVTGTAEVQPPPAKIVHPRRRDVVRETWATPAGPAPFVVVRFEAGRDLQELADTRRVSYVLYKAYACRRSPDWRAEILSGPVFSVESTGEVPIYDIYLPVDVEASIRPRIGGRVGVDLVAELETAEQDGLCVLVGGAKPAGRGFASDLVRIPVMLIEGRLRAAHRSE